MFAMKFEAPGEDLIPRWHDRPPEPGPGQIRLQVKACGVCRTDLHVVDGELARPKLPLVPGHEIIGVVQRSARALKVAYAVVPGAWRAG